MVTVKTVWSIDHTAEQLAEMNKFCSRLRNQGKLKSTEFAEDGSPILSFVDDAAAEEYIALITPWNPTQVIKS